MELQSKLLTFPALTKWLLSNFKPLVHPIVCVYTRKCAANIAEKYERSLVVGYQRFARANKVYFPNKSVTTCRSKNKLLLATGRTVGLCTCKVHVSVSYSTWKQCK